MLGAIACAGRCGRCEWPKLAREAALDLVKGGRDEALSPGVEMLQHIKEAFGEERVLWTQTLLERLHSRPESPWNDISGKPLNDRGLARRLKDFGIKSCDVKLNEVNRKGYKAEDFARAWEIYLPPAEEKPACPTSATSATSATNLNNQNKKVAQVALVALRGGKESSATLEDRTCRNCDYDDGQTTPHGKDDAPAEAASSPTSATPDSRNGHLRDDTSFIGPPGDSLGDFDG